MIEKQKTTSIEVLELAEKAKMMHADKYRLVQIGCTKCPEVLEINYSFDRDYQFMNFRITLPLNGALVPSVSGIYWSALLYENEIQDLYGVKFSDLVLDYKGTFYRTAVKYPFNPDASQKDQA